MKANNKLIFSSYYCNPYLPSESSSAFRWLQILLKRYQVILITNQDSADGIQRFYEGRLPEGLELIVLKDNHFLKDRVRAQVHFGYFTFNRALKKYITRHREELNQARLAIHKTPSSFRYPTSLYLLDVPLMIGPIGGGLQVPGHLKSYFKREPLLNKLRVLDKYLLKMPYVRRAYDKASVLLIVLDYLRDILPERYAEKTRVILESGIEVPEMPEKKPHEGPVRILYVGKLIRYKGAELALRAIQPLREKVVFDIVGDGVERNYLESITQDLNLTGTVRFHGNVPYEKVEEYYQNADIFFFPSLTEASGNVLLEAMKNQLPMVTVNNGGPKYMCPDDGAIKVDIGPPEQMIEELTAGLSRLIEDPEMRIRMGEINHRHCRENYSWQVTEERIFNLVEEVAR